MQEMNIAERISHRIFAGGVDPVTKSLIITRDEARELIAGVYSAANRKYLDALQKGFSKNPVEAELQNRGKLDFLNYLRTALENQEYERVIYDPWTRKELEIEFGVPLVVQMEG